MVFFFYSVQYMKVKWLIKLENMGGTFVFLDFCGTFWLLSNGNWLDRWIIDV